VTTAKTTVRIGPPCPDDTPNAASSGGIAL
jgi:hypothetical protein